MSSLEHQSRNEKMIDKLSQIVLDNLSNEQFGVEELASSYGISRSQLHRKLKKLTKKSISRFIREIRLDEAHKMLRQEAGTVSEIAYRVGFSSPTYFNTCFRDYFGYPPGEAKYHKEKGPPAVSSGPETHASSRKPFLIGLATVLVLAMVWLAFINYQDGTEVTIEDEIPIEKSIAVLPFKNWSGDPGLEYVSDGMTDAVISRLSKISDIDRVIPFSTIVSYKNSNKPIDEIADELGVEYVVEGSFKLSGDDVQSNLNLIEVSTNKHIWSLEYNGLWKIDQIFEMQAEISENIAENMDAIIQEEELSTIHVAPTQNQNAYELYLQARFETGKGNIEGIQKAIHLFEQVIEIDPDFVDAYIYLAESWSIGGMIWGAFPEDIAWEHAQNSLEKALELDEQNHWVVLQLHLGYFYYEWDFDKMERFYKAYYKDWEGPEYPGFITDYEFKTGRHSQALKTFDSQISNDPKLYSWQVSKALTLYLMGEAEKSNDLLQRYDKYLINDMASLREAARVYLFLEEYERLGILLEQIESGFSDRTSVVLWLTAVQSQVVGNSEKEIKAIKALEANYAGKASGSPAWFLALYYFHIKDYDIAFEWLNKSYDNHEVELTWLKEEPILRPLRTDPRYVDLYEKVGFPFPITPYKEIIP